MTRRPHSSSQSLVMTKLLATALVIVTLLPIVVFATDFTNSGAVRATRQTVLKRAAVRGREEAPGVRRERTRMQRAKIHPSVATVLMSVTFQIVMLTAIAVVGRRLFALRL